MSATTRAAYHALAGGTMSVVQGGKFGAGFISAGFAKFATLKLSAAGVFKTESKSFGSIMGRTSVAAVVGGTASELGGGKFKNGAASAAMAHLLNSELSSMRAQAVIQNGMASKEALEAQAINGKSFVHYTGQAASIYNSAVTAIDVRGYLKLMPKSYKNLILFSRDVAGKYASDAEVLVQRLDNAQKARYLKVQRDIYMNKPENIDGYKEYGRR